MRSAGAEPVVAVLRAEGECEANLALMRRIDELYMACPFHGSRQMARHLWRSLKYDLGREGQGWRIQLDNGPPARKIVAHSRDSTSRSTPYFSPRTVQPSRTASVPWQEKDGDRK